MPPPFSGKFSSIKLRHCPFCKPLLLASDTNLKGGDIQYHTEAGEPNNARAKPLLTNSEECSKYETPDMKPLCQCL